MCEARSSLAAQEVMRQTGAVAVVYRYITASLPRPLAHSLSLALFLPPNTNDESFNLASSLPFLALRHSPTCASDNRWSAPDRHHNKLTPLTNSPSPAYFDIQEPQAGRQWANGAANPVQWKKGLLDDISSFDIEIGRLSVDGILFVAQHGASCFYPFIFLTC